MRAEWVVQVKLESRSRSRHLSQPPSASTGSAAGIHWQRYLTWTPVVLMPCSCLAKGWCSGATPAQHGVALRICARIGKFAMAIPLPTTIEILSMYCDTGISAACSWPAPYRDSCFTMDYSAGLSSAVDACLFVQLEHAWDAAQLCMLASKTAHWPANMP